MPPLTFDMDETRHTDRLRAVLRQAYSCSTVLMQEDVSTEHLLIALLRDEEGRACLLLQREFSVKPGELRAQVEALMLPQNFAPQARRAFSPQALGALKLAHDAALSHGHSYVGTEHLLLGLVCEGSSRAAATLRQAGVTQGVLNDAVAAADRDLPLLKLEMNERAPAETPATFWRRRRVYVFSIMATLFGPMALLLSFHDETLAFFVFVAVVMGSIYLPHTYDRSRTVGMFRPHIGWGYFWKVAGALHAAAAIACSVLALHEAEGPGQGELHMRWWLGVAWCWGAAVLAYMAGDTQFHLIAKREDQAASAFVTQRKNPI